MRLFAKKSQTPELTVAELAAQLEHFRERDAFYLLTLRALLYCMKEFSLDLVEIEAAQFKERMDGLTHALLSDLSVAKLHRAFARSKDDILSYIEREKLYFRDRENEFKHIIELLSTGLTTLTQESQDFHTQLYAHSTRLENITYLDDLRQLKEALRREVEQIKVQIRDKQARDTAHVAALSPEVNTLRVDVEHAQTAARTDGLTGAFNRAAFDVCLCQAVERHTVTPSPFALLLIDIDNFKRINDTYGHQVGDRVLIALVQQCKAAVRRDDFLARYGGEEFALILPGASLRNALKKARALCKTIAGMQYTIDESRPSEKLAFTVSIGVSALCSGDTAHAVIKRADMALYAAKHQGKNRAVSEK